MKNFWNRALICLLTMNLFSGTAAFAEETSSEDPVANVVSNAETILKASALHSLTVNVKNTHGATSSLTIEIREGGCEGKLIARFPLRSNDSVSYMCTGDYVRIVADDPAASKYTYDVLFAKSERKPISHSFDATGKNRVYMGVTNTTTTMTKLVVVNSSTNEGTMNGEVSIEPKVNANWNEPADIVKVTVGEGANVPFNYSVKFASL